MQEWRGEANVSMEEAHLWHRSPRPSRGWQVPAEDSPWHTNSTAGLCFSRPWGIVQILNTYIYTSTKYKIYYSHDVCILQSQCLHTTVTMSVYYSWCLHTIHDVCILYFMNLHTTFMYHMILLYTCVYVRVHVHVCVHVCLCMCVCACPKEALHLPAWNQ